jgi:hypothetical protein
MESIPIEKSSSRRTGVYIPSKSRQKLVVDKEEKEKMDQFWKEEVDTLKRIQSQIQEEEKLSKRKNIEWKYIQPPSTTRQSLIPKSEQNILVNAIEKTALGDYFYLNYLEKTTQNICFIAPKLDDVIDAIRLIYLIQKQGIEFQTNWGKMKPLLTKSKLSSLYEKTFPWIAENYDVFVETLEINPKGPQISSNDNERIIFLINYLLERHRTRIDVLNKYNFIFPDMDQLKNCLKQSDKRYIVFFLKFILKAGGHANMIIIDKQKKIVERFEPLGLGHRHYNEGVVNQILTKLFEKIGYEYIGPINLCPLGVQADVDKIAIKKYHYTGFCQTWSFLYALFRLTYGDEIDAKILSEKILEYTKIIAEEYIQEQYGKSLDVKEEDQELESRKLITEFFYDFIPEILDYGKEEIEKINKIFGTTLDIDGRSIIYK